MQLKLRRRNENQRTFRRHIMTAVFRLSPRGKVRKYYASLVSGMSSDCQQTVKPANSENTYCQTRFCDQRSVGWDDNAKAS